jgi:ferredoxin
MPTLNGKEVKIIVDRTCTSCGQCVAVCPAEYLELKDGKPVERANPVMGCITCGHCAAICPEAAITVETEGMSREDVFAFSSSKMASHEELFRLMANRRSVRQFQERAVPREVTDKILEAAQQAPAGLPPSTVRAAVIDGKDKVRSFAFDFLDETGKMGWMFSPVGIWTLRPFMSAEMHKEMREKIAPLYRGLLDGRKQGKDFLFYDAPLAMIFTASGDATDAVIACTYAMIAAESLGLGSCMIGTVTPMLPRVGKAFKEKYGLAGATEYGLAIVFGYPKVKFQQAVRRRFAGITQ